MATLQEDAGALGAQTDAAGAGGHISLIYLQLVHALPLLLLELLEGAALLLTLAPQRPLPPQNVEQCSAGGQPEQARQQPPEPSPALLLAQQRGVVLPTQEVAQALLGWLQLDHVVVQHQLAHAGHALAQPQHLLGLADALGPLAADEVADHVA